MKVRVRNTSLKLVLQWAQHALFAGAILMLGYCGFVLVDTWIFQNQESAALDWFVPERPVTLPASLPTLPESVPAIAPDGLIGRIEIVRLGVSVVVVEGTSKRAFRRAVGHIAGTALPGQPGNVGIAGHRDTFFRSLRNIQPDDIITLTTLRGEYRYRVVSTKVVSPDNVAVLDPDESQILTLVTCYPFYFVGSAPDRFIVRAERVT
ncbi:MAG: class D sortase [Acidobacteriia bacterium]|nr:class D sortase [Terriglobia bacterium]